MLSTLILKVEVPEMTLSQEQTITPTPIYISRRISMSIYISEDIYCTLLLWVTKFSGFLLTKTSVNIRLFYYILLFTS